VASWLKNNGEDNMKLSQAMKALVVLCGAMLFSAIAFAAEFSPALEQEMAQKSDQDLVSAIIIMESPIDIQVLDAKLHAAGASRADRYHAVMDALQYNARATQPQFQAELNTARAQGQVTGYTAFWIDNLFVVQATKSFVRSLQNRGDIRVVTENFRPVLMEPVARGDDHGNGAEHLDNLTIPPGIRAIGAYRVNTELGITGQGVLIGSLDTGVDATHPALSTRWRGYNGAHPWQECWKDALGSTTVPSDGHGHGTHTVGTMAGRAISGSDTVWIGCAPAAQWISDNAINQGTGSGFDNDIIAAFQWFTNPDGNVNTLDDVPDVVQNSWGVNGTFSGYTDCFAMWNTVALNCEAAGVVVTWSAGNEGPTASSMRAPATFSFNATQIFSVGAVDAGAYPTTPYPIASFSSRGPTICTPFSPDNIKPEVCAPGVNVYSAAPGGGYQLMSGTSMAGPHVAGVVALMREACPNCDPTTIKQTLLNTAIDYGTVGQDNTYGYGFVDAYEAVLAVMGGMGRLMGTIRDANTNLPLAGTVSVIGGQQRTADVNGQYQFMLRGDSTYTIRYSMIGYFNQELSVTVSAGDTTIQNVSLAPRPILYALTENVESGASGWTHAASGGAWVDDWHVSTERAHGGTHSFKCGDQSTGTYRALNDALLTSPVVSNIPPDAQLLFWHEIESENSSRYADSAYDGGTIELSVDGGPFVSVTPTANYTHTFRYMAGGTTVYSGPLPGRRCYADSILTWTQVAVDLSAYEGQSLQVRFRFCSDAGTAREGWYVDDVEIKGYGSGVPQTPVNVTILVSGTDLILNWVPNGSPFYRVYANIDPMGAFTGSPVATTSGSTVTLVNAVVPDEKMFYVVKAWDGQP
jgi:subtilisin family serine protease